MVCNLPIMSITKLDRVETWLESVIAPRVACSIAYALGILTIGMKWTAEDAGMWILLAAVMTSAFGASLKVLSQARRLDSETATLLTRAAMAIVLFPFTALLAL